MWVDSAVFFCLIQPFFAIAKHVLGDALSFSSIRTSFVLQYCGEMVVKICDVNKYT